MYSLTNTHPGLLVRIREPNDAQAWEEFIKLYSPYVYRYCRKYGLQDADAADVVQDVLQALVNAISGFQYDRQRGLFRHYLLKVTRSKLYNFLKRRQREPQAISSASCLDILVSQPSSEDESVSDCEFQRQVFEQAAERVRTEFQKSTWRAFRLTAVEGVTAKQAARRLGMTVQAVYIAKCRVLKRLKERIRANRQWQISR